MHMRKRDEPDVKMVIGEGNSVLYQYDDGEDGVAIARVEELYENAAGEPMFKHTCYWTAADMKKACAGTPSDSRPSSQF